MIYGNQSTSKRDTIHSKEPDPALTSTIEYPVGVGYQTRRLRRSGPGGLFVVNVGKTAQSFTPVF